MNTIDFNRLIHAATYYLSYQDRIGRSFMIDESSLKYPVADYLSSLEIPLANIHIEFPHPDLHKRSLDLITTDNSKTKIENVFEFILSKSNTKYEAEQKRIFYDLVRLYLLYKSQGASCYFFIAGTQAAFIQNFRSILLKRPISGNREIPPPQGFYTEWFKFNVNGKQSINVKNTNNNFYEKIYQSFLEEYTAKEKVKC